MIPYSIRWLSAIVVPLWKMQADGSWFLKSYATELGLLIFSIKTDGYRRSADRLMLKSNRFLNQGWLPTPQIVILYLACGWQIKLSMLSNPQCSHTNSRPHCRLNQWRQCMRYLGGAVGEDSVAVQREESWKVAKSGRFRTSIAQDQWSDRGTKIEKHR